MNKAAQLVHKTSLGACLIVSAALLALPPFAGAQDQQQQTGSLADAARQARAQKQAQGADAGKAQQIANELSDDQNAKTTPVQPRDPMTPATGTATNAPASQNSTAAAQKSSDATVNNGASSATTQTGASAAPAGNAPTPSANPTQTAAAPTSSTPAAQNSMPKGPKAQPFNYCKRQNDCWDASVLVPADAKLITSECKQYVFETKVKGNPYMLMAGPAGDACLNSNKSTANQVHWGELATPESALPPGAFNLISSEETTLAGQPALQIEIGFRKGLTEWTGKRIELQSNGVPLVVGCMAPREHFEDGAAVCSAWMQSLRLP
jgi:hypothetical protein